MLIEVKVGALIMDPNSSTPIIVLKGLENEAILPIWVGAYEANAIALEIEKIVPQRPMTHDLIRNFIIQLGYYVNRVVVSDLKDNTFYALIELRNEKDEILTLDARPSDAIALALRLDCPIFVDDDVIKASSSSSAPAQTEIIGDEDIVRSDDEWSDWIG